MTDLRHLDWLPPALHRYVTSLNEQVLRLDLVPYGAPNQIALGRIPDGWQIEIDHAGTREATDLDAENATGVTWALSNVGRQPVTLGAALRSVHITGSRMQQVRLDLSRNGQKLHLAPGLYRIDGDHTYQVWLEADSAQPQYTLTGSATCTALTGAGTVKIKKPVELDKLDFEGSLDVEAAVEIDNLRLGGDLTCHKLEAVTVVASSVTIARSGNTDPSLHLAGQLQAGSVQVRGQVLGTTATAQLNIGQQLVAASLAHVQVHASSDNRPRVKINGRVGGCAFIGPLGEVELQSSSGGLTVQDATALKVTHHCTDDLTVIADSVEVGALTGTGSIECQTFRSEADVIGANEDVTITASQALTIVGSARRANLICDGDIAVGPTRDRPLRVTKLSLTADADVAPAQISANAQPKGQPVRTCLIYAGGDAQVALPVEDSVLHAESRLVLLSHLDLRGVDAEAVTARAPESAHRRLSADRVGQPCTAGELLVGGEVYLDVDHQILATTAFSAQAVTGGAVLVRKSDGVFVARTIRDTNVTSASLGLAAAPTGTTMLEASTLMRLDGGAPAETQLTIHGDAVFGAAVACPVTWRPTGDHVCNLAAGATRVTIAPTELATGDVPQLILARGQTLQHLHLSGLTRLSLHSPTSQPRIRSRDTQPDRVWESVTLGSGAHLVIDADAIDLGMVTLEARAALTRASTGGNAPVLRLAAVPEGRELALAPGAGVTIIDPEPEDAGDDPAHGPPTVRIGSGAATIATALGRVICKSDEGDAPSLTVSADGVIAEASGPFQLAALHGRLTSRRPSPPWRTAILGRGLRLWGRFTAYRWGARRGDSAGLPAKLVRIIEPGSGSLARGELVGVDVSELPFTDIRALAELHVFDPDGESLIDYACDVGKTSTRPQVSKHERAQRLKLLSEIAATNANSGATRSAVMWAAARAQHALIDARHWVEKAGRRALRTVGYGYRPWPAFITYAAVVIGLSAALYLVDDGCGCVGFRAGPYSFGDQIIRVLVLPVSTVRLDFGGATAYAPIGCHAGLHALVFAGTGLVLGFLIVAIRNYMRTPTRRQV